VHFVGSFFVFIIENARSKKQNKSCSVSPFINQHLRTILFIPNHILVRARHVSVSPDTIFNENTLSILRQHIKWL